VVTLTVDAGERWDRPNGANRQAGYLDRTGTPGDPPVLGFSIDAQTRDRVIDYAIAQLRDSYVSPELAKQMGEALRRHHKRGATTTRSPGRAPVPLSILPQILSHRNDSARTRIPENAFGCLVNLRQLHTNHIRKQVLVFFVTRHQTVVGNAGGKVVNMMVADIDSKPVQPARQE
jgi:hypothetical protein